MTHALRSIHDAILVGGRTLVIDNPRLSNRLWAASSGVHQQQPRPVVLDTDLKYIRSLGDSCRAKNIIVCCSNDAAAASDCQDISQTVTILPCRVQEDGTIDLSHVLIELKKLGIKSLLVEGGAKVLSAFASKNLVDCLAVTISPKLLGDKGLPAFSNVFLDTNRQLDSPRFFPLGDDCILLSRWFGVNQCAD
jgi:riboflavin-specific deaminase-like protein